MLKFKVLLWALARLLQRAIKSKPGCANYVRGKELLFQIQTRDGVGRYFTIKNGAVSSRSGLAKSPQFVMAFRNATKGFAVLSAKDSKEAFLAALHDEDLVLSGDFVEVMWFQGLTEYLRPGKK